MGKEVEFIHAQIVHLDPVDRNRTSITFKSLKSENGFSYNPSLDNSVYGWKSWGSCMRKAMDKLFDVWENDPVGIFGCWVMSPFCVVGAGLACLVKEVT